MKISKAHKRFSERLENPRVLTNPEEFLGPNYKAVLNFWMILDELSEDQWIVIKERYTNEVLRECGVPLNKSPKKFAHYCCFSTLYRHIYYDKGNNVQKITTAIIQSCPGPSLWATDEIIGEVKNPVFFPMFLDL